MRFLAHAISRLVIALVVLSLSASAGAVQWGPRVGLSSDPDQVFGGVQFDAGEIWRNTRVAPSIQAGIGDDAFTLCGAVGLHYIFRGMGGRWQPYAGGELGFIYINVDRDLGPNQFGRDDDFEDTELGISAAGGLQTRLTSGNLLNFELRIGFIDAQDVQFHVGWLF